jgi:gas vesicle protein
VDATTANSEKSKVQTAKEEAVAQVRSVAETAGEQTRNVASDIGEEMKAQLGEQKGRLASSIREIGDELEQAAQGSSGTVAGLAGQAAQTTRDVSRWIETHEPRDVLAEIEGFARQRPVLFVAGAAALGVLVGRVTRNAVAVARDTSSGQTVDLRQATAEPGGTSLHPVPHLTGEPVDEAILGASAGPLQQRGMAADEPIVPGDVLPEAGPAIGQGRQAGGPA